MTSGRWDPSDDAGVVLEMAAGSEVALETLYDRHATAIFAAVYRLTSDRGTAEEVVQETFLTLWNRAETFDPTTGSLASWLHAIARNRAIDRLRANGRRPSLVGLAALAAPDEAPSQALDRLATHGSVVAGSAPAEDPEAALLAAGMRDALRVAVAEMPDDERRVILLAYQDDLSQTEIAERLGWPLGTVKTRTRRALHRLRTALGGEFGHVADDAVMPVSAGEDR
jgi:RNA polymerase sigma-70 factor (ECF subfamily)